MTRILGIDISPEAVKIAEVEIGLQKAKVVNSAAVHLEPQEIGDNHGAAVAAELKEKNIATRQAVAALSSPQVFYHLIELPPMPANEVVQAIHFKLKTLLPEGQNNVVLDFFKIEGLQHEGKTLYFLAVVSREFIIKVAGLFKKHGIFVKDIIPGSCALYYGAGIKSAGTYVLANIEKRSTLIVLVKLGQIVFAREVSLGSENLKKSLIEVVVDETGKLDIDEPRAEKILNEFGVPIDLDDYTQKTGIPAYEVISMLRPALEKIGAEILRTFEYYKHQTGDEVDFKQIYCTGSGSKIINLVKYLDSVMELEVLNLAGPETDACLTRAAGAATEKKSCLSLYPMDLKYPLLSWIRKYIAFEIPFILLIAIFIAVWFSLFTRSGSLERQLAALKDQAAKSGTKIEEPTQSEKIILGFSKEIETQKKYIRIMQDLTGLTPPNVYFQKISFNKNSREFIIGGIVEKDSGISEFISKLSKSGFFLSVDLVGLKESDRYTVPTQEFDIKCVMIGEQKS